MLDGYGIVNGVDTDAQAAQQKLIDNMLFRMKQGWMPQGGVSLLVVPTSPDATYVFAQAVVRQAKE